MQQRWPAIVVIGLLFFLSGFTGLVYEVIWSKYLALLLGSTAYAQVGVLAVFMGGLALGSALWGRQADLGRWPLRLYGYLEIAIGIATASFALGFDHLGQLYWSTLAMVDNSGLPALAVRTALCIVAMLVPTLCMGGTLPVLSRALNLQRAHFGRGVAYLYGINSLGAASGSLTAGFLLVPSWGFDAPFLAAAALNVVIGVAAIAMQRKVAAAVVPEAAAIPQPAASSEAYQVAGYSLLVPVAAALSGAVAMIYEVAWIRLCSLILGSSTYSFSIMLTAFIVGIAAGGLVYSGLEPARGRPLRFYALTSLLCAVVVLATLPFYDRLPFAFGRIVWLLRQQNASFAWFQVATLVFCVGVMLPLTFISGLNFPALAHAAAQHRPGVGRPVAWVLVANTSGTILGTVLGGLVLMPILGLQRLFLLCCGLTLSMVAVVLACDRSARRFALAMIASISVGFPTYLAWVPDWDLRLLTLGEFRRREGLSDESFATYAKSLHHKLLYYRDGASATVSVDEWPEDIVLRVNGKADASANGDRETQLLSAHIPAVLSPKTERALIIGYGSGMTAGALLRHPLKSLDMVEISPEVIEADRFFRDVNYAPLEDARLRVHIEDARTFLYRNRERYDLIISEPSNPWIAGVANLFTTELFAQVKEHLSDDGLFVQWFHTYETSDPVVRLILRSVSSVFPEVRTFQPNRWDVIIIAAPRPIRLQPAAAAAVFQRAGDLGSVDVRRLSTLLALEILPDVQTRSVAGEGPLNRDRVPLLEHAAPRAFHDGRSARLLARAPLSGEEAFLQSTADLDVGALRDLATYLQRYELLSYHNAVRFLARWFELAPNDPPLHSAIGAWTIEQPRSTLLLSRLVAVAERAPQAARMDYVQGLTRAISSSPSGVSIDQVRLVDPLLRDAGRRSGNLGLLRQLAGWYVFAQSPADALAVGDLLIADADAEQRARGHCLRAEVLELLQRRAEARNAYEACAGSADPGTQQAAVAGLRRLDAGR